MRTLAIPTAALVLLLAVPVGAAEPEPTAPCAVSQEYPVLGLAGKHADVAPSAVPSVGHDIAAMPYREESVTRYRFRLDLSGSQQKPAAKSARVQLNLSWDNATDFDLWVYDAAGQDLGKSVTFNPLDGSGEAVTLALATHCSDVRIDVLNYLGAPTSAVDLDIAVSNLK